MNTCPKCGSFLMPEAKTCANCGTPIGASTPGAAAVSGPDPAERFRKAENEFFRLKGLLDTGRIGKEQYERDLQALMVQDTQGRYWNLGAGSGRWHLFDGQRWVVADPYGGNLPVHVAPTSPPSLAEFPLVRTAPAQPPSVAAAPAAAASGGGRLLLIGCVGAVVVMGVAAVAAYFAVGSFGGAFGLGKAAPTPTLVAAVVQTNTPIPPTATPVPPTATAIPPTATGIPPSATPSRTPTAIPSATSTGTPAPTATTSDAARLRAQLDDAWGSGDWQRVVALLEALRLLDPADLTIPGKLYAARVNYGNQLLAQGNRTGAAAQCQAALVINPSGVEALQCLAQASPPTATRVPPPPPQSSPAPPAPTSAPTPQVDVYVSVRGYEQWGRPSADDCDVTNDKDPVRRFTVDVTITNRTSQGLTRWYPTIFTTAGNTARTCYYGSGMSFPSVPAGGTRTVTFAGYMEQSEYASEMQVPVFDYNVRRCFAPWDGHLVSCP